MSEEILLPEKDVDYLVEAVRQGIGVYGLIGPDGKPFVPNYENIRRVLSQTPIKVDSDRMQFEVPPIVRENPDEGNINSHLFVGADRLQRDFMLRRVCKTHLTGYKPNGFKRWINLAEKSIYQKFAGRGFGIGADSEFIGRKSREELPELLHISADMGYDYYLIGMWEREFPVRRAFGGGDSRFYMPVCFFPGIDLSSVDSEGKNHPRDMLCEFSKFYQLPKHEEVEAIMIKERKKKL